ncbi:HesA/MoeB/ThiF family protein [Mangrovivirga sp. M17]|uniref:HesA/MoeB/ThiF family protein n=1 Tax=Mangrovivirga halotolerans TaxID=2993936 RepID=A0ABT3RVI0_9BACT|nr:HesA/MoeB/ThiF family protein [Mangrovivirga halotolerans]MCX2745551.1 HesA/MoeB/ThiF family protein [Mangrovivirga halotolerans]
MNQSGKIGIKFLMMLTNLETEQYRRQMVLPEIGEEGQDKLKNSNVLVVGAGGLGCPVLSYLVACGVGKIGIIDDDNVEVSNLHRQVLYSHQDVGINKAKVAAQKLRNLNPSIDIVAYSQRLTAQNAIRIIKDYNLLVDCTDNFRSRYLINDTCVILNKPFVFGSVLRFEGQVSVFNYQNGPTYRCLFNTPPNPENSISCNDAGVLGLIPGIVGSFQAMEVIKIICGIGEVLFGKLMIYNGLKNEYSWVKIDRDENKVNISSLSDSIYSSEIIKTKDINPIELKGKVNDPEWIIIDVREKDEVEVFGDLFNAICIPLKNLKSEINCIPKNRRIALVCQSGIRSSLAANIFIENGYEEVYNLKNGINSLVKS